MGGVKGNRDGDWVYHIYWHGQTDTQFLETIDCIAMHITSYLIKLLVQNMA